jgi:hypothetical protein
MAEIVRIEDERIRVRLAPLPGARDFRLHHPTTDSDTTGMVRDELVLDMVTAAKLAYLLTMAVKALAVRGHSGADTTEHLYLLARVLSGKESLNCNSEGPPLGGDY